MDMNSIAKSVIVGEPPTVTDMIAYWTETDAGARPREETIAVLGALAGRSHDKAVALSFALYVAERYPQVELNAGADAVNIVGTGGGPSTFNISTAAAIVAAAAGAKVVKSGSGAYSGSVGSSDVLAGLGLASNMSDEMIDEMLEEIGVAFSPVSRYAPICRRLAMSCMPLEFKTIGRFINRMGPLIGPHKVGSSVIGASTETLFNLMLDGAEALERDVMVVMSDKGVDEFLSISDNRCAESLSGDVWIEKGTYIEGPCNPMKDLRGGDLDYNVRKLRNVLAADAPAIAVDTVALNAGAAIYKAGLSRTIAEGQSQAWYAMLSGAATCTLNRAVEFVRASRERTPKMRPVSVPVTKLAA